MLGDGTSVRLPDGRSINNGWGEIGSIDLVGDRQKALPVRLTITWFSYTENEFYTGTFDLPSAEIATLFATGFRSPLSGEARTYGRVIVGMAPGGVVSVWLAGEGVVRAVATLHAARTTGEWKSIIDNPDMTREAFIESVLTELLTPEEVLQRKTSGVPLGAWEGFAMTYPLVPVIVGGAARSELWATFLNGEAEFTDLSKAGSAEQRLRALPAQFEIRWMARSGTKYFTRVSFDRDELLAAVTKLMQDSPKNSLQLAVDLSAAPTQPGVSLRSDRFVLELRKIGIKTRAE